MKKAILIFMMTGLLLVSCAGQKELTINGQQFNEEDFTSEQFELLVEFSNEEIPLRDIMSSGLFDQETLQALGLNNVNFNNQENGSRMAFELNLEDKDLSAFSTEQIELLQAVVDGTLNMKTLMQSELFSQEELTTLLGRLPGQRGKK